MEYYLNQFFSTSEEIDNPDIIIKYIPKFDEYEIPVYDGGSSMIEIKYCPGCGEKLPESKRDLWFETLEKLKINVDSEDDIPEEFKSNKWYCSR